MLMARIAGGDWQKLVIGVGKKVIHDTSPAGGEYGFYEAKWTVDGVMVKGQVYPDFGGERWLWGVRFNAQDEVLGWDTERKANVVTRAQRKEYRVGGHASTRLDAQKAAEQVVHRGRPEESTT